MKTEKKQNNNSIKSIFKITLFLMIFLNIASGNVFASPSNVIDMNINGTTYGTIEIILFMTLVTLGPSIVIMMTSFTRIIVVLSFLRSALGMQQTPPNQVMIGLALFLTLFIMSPVIEEINTEAYQPFRAEEINQEQFFEKASEPIKGFMLKQTGEKELDMYITLSRNTEVYETQDISALPLTVVIPAFMTSELRRAFIMGFLLYIPFLVIDIIVSTVLMSMGMMMLPPAMIALPFKILLFVLVDGWSLLFKSIVMTFVT